MFDNYLNLKSQFTEEGIQKLNKVLPGKEEQFRSITKRINQFFKEINCKHNLTYITTQKLESNNYEMFMYDRNSSNDCEDKEIVNDLVNYIPSALCDYEFLATIKFNNNKKEYSFCWPDKEKEKDCTIKYNMELIKLLKSSLFKIKFKEQNIFFNKKNFKFKNTMMILIYLYKMYESLSLISDLYHINNKNDLNNIDKFEFVKNKQFHIYILSIEENTFGIYLFYDIKKDNLEKINFSDNNVLLKRDNKWMEIEKASKIDKKKTKCTFNKDCGECMSCKYENAYKEMKKIIKSNDKDKKINNEFLHTIFKNIFQQYINDMKDNILKENLIINEDAILNYIIIDFKKIYDNLCEIYQIIIDKTIKDFRLLLYNDKINTTNLKLKKKLRDKNEKMNNNTSKIEFKTKISKKKYKNLDDDKKEKFLNDTLDEFTDKCTSDLTEILKETNDIIYDKMQDVFTNIFSDTLKNIEIKHFKIKDNVNKIEFEYSCYNYYLVKYQNKIKKEFKIIVRSKILKE